MTKDELVKLSRENLRKSKQGSLCECYDEAFIKGYELSEKHITDLEKENAELRNRNQELLESCEGATTMYKDLCKAKELLTRFIMASVYFNGKETGLVEEAEQFCEVNK